MSVHPHFTRAILRSPAPNFAEGLTTVRWAAPPDYSRLLAQHRAYADALVAAGLAIEILPALPEHPDAYFVEDVAIVVPELAVITRPGAEARRGETPAIVEALAQHRALAFIETPATLDGGDVLVIGPRVFVGLSERSNAAGVAALERLLAPHGYVVTGVPVGAGLHLKSSINLAGPGESGRGLLVAAPALAGRPEFADYELLVLDPSEAVAANVLWVNDRLLIPAGFPRLREQLGSRGVNVVELDMREVAKMDGGLSCLSLRF